MAYQNRIELIESEFEEARRRFLKSEDASERLSLLEQMAKLVCELQALLKSEISEFPD